MAKRDFIKIPPQGEAFPDTIFLSPSRIQAVEYIPGIATTIKMNTQFFQYTFKGDSADAVFAILQRHIDPDFTLPIPPLTPMPGGDR